MLRIKEILKEKRMTAKELAEKIGMTETGLSLIVKGKGNPPLNTLEKIATALDMEIWELFTESNASSDFIALVKFENNFYCASTIKELEEIVIEIKMLNVKYRIEKSDSLDNYEYFRLYDSKVSDKKNIERFKKIGLDFTSDDLKRWKERYREQFERWQKERRERILKRISHD